MIILDGRKMIDQGSAHAYMIKQFHFPFYYGRNLDALWDMLSEYNERTEIYLFHGNRLLENMPDYGRKLIALFKEAAEENEHLYFWTNVGKEVL